MQNNKALFLILVLLAISSYFVIKNNKSTEASTQLNYLIPELQNKINDVTTVNLSNDKQKVTLTKENGVWQIAEHDSYFADANKVAALLMELRTLKLKQMKTNNPDNYSKLGLGTGASQVVLKNDHGEFANVSIGNTAHHGQGTYVRRSEEKQSWLVDGETNIIIDNKEWIVTTIINVDSSQIKSINYTPANSPTFEINKATPADQNFLLKNIPENMQLKADTDLALIANGLQKFTIDSAEVKTELPPETKTMTVNYQLFSGMNYQLDLYNYNEKNRLTITIDNEDSDSGFVKKLENWHYIIPKFKYDALNKSFFDLIEEIPVKTDKENNN